MKRWTLLVLLCMACIERPPSSRERRQSADRSPAQRTAVLVPPGQLQRAHPMEATFGGSITYLGFDVKPDPIRAGEEAEITFYFRSEDELDEDWQVFVHVEDGAGGRLANVDHAPGGGSYPVGLWRRGEIVRDTFRIRVPPAARTVQLWSGFWYPARDERLALDNPAAGTHDGQNRLLAASLHVAE